MNTLTPKGWQCPVCGAVMAPGFPSCVNCTGRKVVPAQNDTGARNALSLFSGEDEARFLEKLRDSIHKEDEK